MAPVDAAASSVPTQASATFVARQFRPDDQEQVVATFLEGMNAFSEYEDNETHTNFIRSSLESDLSDIHGTYIAPGGNFWVVTPAEEPSRVVGMVGLEAKPSKEGELRRMSVGRSYRRFGIGRLLLATLEQWAVAQGFGKLWLTSATAMKPAHALYEASGFAQVAQIQAAADLSIFKYEKPLVGATVDSTRD